MCVRTLLVACLALLSPFAVGDDAATGFQKLTPTAVASGSIELPMELLASRPLVRVKINGQGPFAFLLDPEATQTLIDARLIETLKIVPLKNADGSVERRVDLEVGPSKLENVAFEQRDLSRVVPELGLSGQPRGVLALNVWPDQMVTIDYTRWRVTIEPGALSEPNGKDIFALGASSPELFVAISIGERTFRCHVDPMFPGGLLLPADSILEFPLVEKARDNGSVTTRRGLIPIRLATLETDASLGAFTFKAPQVQFGGSSTDAILGWQWLSDFTISYDVAHGRARLDQPPRRSSAR
ncbi:MAG TPA: hypothetical protein VFV98_14245 [Vicinamibacterales bacterium]|nr:hypothetical protein [Vicinamibacterales bacterium]